MNVPEWSHWVMTLVMTILGPVTVASVIECSDWTGLDHVPTPHLTHMH